MPAPCLHLVGNAHIDPAWLWRWPEGLSETLATFRSALDRLAEHPEFIFTCGSAALYEFVERADPTMFVEIRAAVGAGRWEVVGGFWVEPDTNVASGEVLVRHALMSQRYFRSRFGTTPRVAFNPDAFGHSAGLPQILARAGFDAYVFMRPEPWEAELPRMFWWVAADGSGVRAYRIPVAYSTWPDGLASHIEAVTAALEADDAHDGMCFYGVGNHGGGPTRANIALLDARIAGGDPLIFSSPARYLDQQSRPDARVTGELGYHARGGYSANSALKAAIRRTDAALIGAETAAALAHTLTGAAYPQAELETCWKALLCAGFHDVAAGTVIASAARDALGTLAAAATTAEMITDEAYVTLAWHTSISAPADSTTLVVFNPHPWPTSAPVEAEVAAGRGTLQLTDETGAAVPVQEITSEAVAAGRRRIVFLASLPAGGWACYHLSTGEKDGLDATTFPFEWNVVFDPSTGGLVALTLNSGSVLDAPSAYTTVAPDHSDTWSHGLEAYPPPDGTFAGLTCELLEDGPVRRVFQTAAQFGDSTITQRFLVYAGWDRVPVEVVCDWAERRRVAKMRFAIRPDQQVLVEAPYSSVVRTADGNEYPGGSWLTVTDADGRGYSLANDAKFGYDVAAASIGVTVARSPLSAHHDPAVPDPTSDLEFLDQGRQRFTWVVRSDPTPLAAARMAAELLRPARVVTGSHHPGAPLSSGIAQLSISGAVLGAAKRAEDGQATIVRVHNPGLLAGRTEVSFTGRRFCRNLAPTEVLTLYVPDSPGQPIREAHLLD